MAINEDVAERFASFVKARTFGASFVDFEAERLILGEGVMRWGLGFEEARGMLLALGNEGRVAFQSEIEPIVGDMLADSIGKKNVVTLDQFERASRLYRTLALNAIAPDEARSRVKRMMVSRSWRPRRRNLIAATKWYREVEV